MQNAQKLFHPVKAVAIDLDGTLLSEDLSISSENRAAIERLHAAGVHVILASGRHHISMMPFARALPVVDWMVSSQGSWAANLDQSVVLYNSHLAPEHAARIIDAGKANGYSIIVYTQSGIYTLDRGEWIDYYTRLAGIVPIETTKEQVLEDSIFKVVLLQSESRIDALFDLAEVKDWELNKVRSLKNIFEFAGLGTTKAHGLKPLLNHLGVKPGELAVFGDAPNDVPMFELAGYSFAMDHAWPEAKAAARFIAPAGDPRSSFARAVDMLETVTRQTR